MAHCTAPTEGAMIKISPAARSFLHEALYDDNSFIRVGNITVGGA